MGSSSAVIGKFFETNSFLIKIDARIKMIILIMFLVAIFLAGGFESYCYLSAIVLVAFAASRLPFKLIFAQWKIIIFLFVFLFFLTAALNTVSANTESIYSLGSWHFRQIALSRSIYIAWRILLILIASILLTSTTRPLDLTLALEDLLFPLRLFRLPVHEISMMMTIALRFIPTFIQEAQIVVKAQSSRGLDFKGINVKNKINASISLMIPLFLSSIQKAEDLANAMDVRGYFPGSKRTRARTFKLKWYDLLVFLFFVGVLVLIGLTVHAGAKNTSTMGWNPSLHWWGWLEPQF